MICFKHFPTIVAMLFFGASSFALADRNPVPRPKFPLHPRVSRMDFYRFHPDPKARVASVISLSERDGTWSAGFPGVLNSGQFSFSRTAGHLTSHALFRGWNPMGRTHCENLLGRHSETALTVMLERGVITQADFEEQREILARVNPAQVAFGLAWATLKQSEWVSATGSIPKYSIPTPHFSPYAELGDEDERKDPRLDVAIGTASVISSQILNKGKLETHPMNWQLSREGTVLYPLFFEDGERAFELGRLTLRSLHAKDPLGRTIAAYILNQVLLTGGDPAKTWIYGHALDAEHRDVYEKHYGMKFFREFTPGETILRCSLQDLLREFPPQKSLSDWATAHSLNDVLAYANEKVTQALWSEGSFSLRPDFLRSLTLTESPERRIHFYNGSRFLSLRQPPPPVAANPDYARSYWDQEVASVTSLNQSVDFGVTQVHRMVHWNEQDPAFVALKRSWGVNFTNDLSASQWMHWNRGFEIDGFQALTADRSSDEIIAVLYGMLYLVAQQVNRESPAQGLQALAQNQFQFALSSGHGPFLWSLEPLRDSWRGLVRVPSVDLVFASGSPFFGPRRSRLRGLDYGHHWVSASRILELVGTLRERRPDLAQAAEGGIRFHEESRREELLYGPDQF